MYFDAFRDAVMQWTSVLGLLLRGGFWFGLLVCSRLCGGFCIRAAAVQWTLLSEYYCVVEFVFGLLLCDESLSLGLLLDYAVNWAPGSIEPLSHCGLGS